MTRQAVSSWETGKTQPDIETLTALAEALHADVRELIYGPGRIERPYARFQRRYIICTAVCVLVFLAWIVMELTLEPYLAELLGKGYIVWPIFVYGVTVSLFAYSAVGVFRPLLSHCGETFDCDPIGCGGRWRSWACCSEPLCAVGIGAFAGEHLVSDPAGLVLLAVEPAFRAKPARCSSPAVSCS